MRTFTDQQLQDMTVEEAEAAVINSVYEATQLIERLESRGKVVGNGHHARQKLARYAGDELKARWIKHATPTPTDTSTSTSGSWLDRDTVPAPVSK